MDTTSRQIEHIAWLDLMLGQHVDDGAVLHPPLIFLLGDFAVEPRIKEAVGLGIDNIPHLRLSHFSVYPLGHFIVGVNLDTEVFLGIDELDEKRHLSVILACHCFPQEAFGGDVDDGYEVFALILSVADDAET